MSLCISMLTPARMLGSEKPTKRSRSTNHKIYKASQTSVPLTIHSIIHGERNYHTALSVKHLFRPLQAGWSQEAHDCGCEEFRERSIHYCHIMIEYDTWHPRNKEEVDDPREIFPVSWMDAYPLRGKIRLYWLSNGGQAWDTSHSRQFTNLVVSIL